ncbi:MAG: BrnT family toxin [Archaeoglobales archaeon]|nr:MAG: BrnT family toxin [Archaeoglobales archaeon]
MEVICLLRIKPEILTKIRDKHAVDIEEVYEVFEGKFVLTRVKGNRYRVIGQTTAGRYLTIFMDKIGKDFEIVTARNSTDSEKRFYKKEIR